MENIISMTILMINNQPFSYSLRFSSRRRSVQIRVPKPGCLELAAPTGMPWIKIQQLVQSKHAWILRQVRHLESAAAQPTNASLTHGATLLYQGAPHTLLLLADGKSKPSVTYSPCTIAVHLSELIGQDNDPAVSGSLKKWYVKQAQQQLLERTRHWATQIGVQPSRLSLRDQKTRWGSCSSRGAISFNWRIIMAPPAVLDYLVVHELCHLLHPNHSVAYWREVARHLPDCRNLRLWLRQNSSVLMKLMSTGR